MLRIRTNRKFPDKVFEFSLMNYPFLARIRDHLLTSDRTRGVLEPGSMKPMKVMYAITKIKGIGRRFSNLILKKCDVDMNKRAGELTPEEINKIVAVLLV